MTPEEVGAWLQAHGGPAGGEGPDANGRIVQRAADGSYVVQQMERGGAMRVVETHETAPPAEGGAMTSPAVPASPPGSGRVNQGQMEAILAQAAPNGDTRRLEPIYGSKTRMMPGDAYSPGGKPIQIQTITWIDRGTGMTIEAEVEPEGRGYTVTYNGIKESNRGSAASTAQQTTPQRPHEEVDPTNPTRIRRWNPDANDGKGGWEDAGPNQKEIDARAEKDKPKPEQRNGQWGYWDTKKTPPVWVTIQGGPGADQKPVEINGTWGTWKPDPAGGPPTFQPVTGAPQSGTGLKNLDPFEPDYSRPDLGLGGWAERQRQKIGLPPEQGGISQKDYDSAVTAAHGQAATAITNITGATNVRRQAEQDERGQRKDLSDQAAADYGRAQTVFNNIWEYTKPGSRNIMGVIPAIMDEQARYRKESEATARPAPPLHPMFQWTGQAAPSPARTAGFGFTPGAPPAPGGAAAPPPAPGAPPAPVAANAAAMPPRPAPVAPTPAPVPMPTAPPPTQPLSPPTGAPGYDAPLLPQGPPTAGEPGGPPLAPGPVWMPPNPAEMAPYQDEQQAPTPTPTPMPAMAAPPPPPQSEIVDPYQSSSPQFPPMTDREYDQTVNGPIVDPYNPGDPGDYDPVLQSKVLPSGPVSAWAHQALGTPEQMAATAASRSPMQLDPAMYGHTPENPMMQPGQPGQGAPAFDPFPVAGRMAQLGLDAADIAQAMAEMGYLDRQEAMA